MLAQTQTPARTAPRRKPSQLDESVKGLLLQFRITVPKLLPKTLEEIATDEKPVPLGLYGPGMLFIHDDCPAVGIRAFLFELADAGFTLAHADVFATEQGHEVAYVFSRDGVSASPAELCRLNQSFEPALQFLSRRPWQLHAYCNPHLTEPGVWGMSIICRPSHHQKAECFLRVTEGRVVLD